MNRQPNLSVLFEGRDYPVLQNKVYETFEEALASPTGNIRLVQDPNSGLIFNELFEPERVIYDADYQNEQAVSGAFRTHLLEVAEICQRNFEGQSLIELGCGKGAFLELLAARGMEIHGFDASYEGSNPRVRKRYFNRDTGMQADVLILRHVLEHIEDPLAFLGDMLKANGDKGLIYIEVPCFDWIIRNKAWFDIYYEHVNYFRLADFKAIFSEVRETGHLFGGQYIYVVAELQSLVHPEARVTKPLQMPEDFMASLYPVDDGQEANKTPMTAVWGGASKGVIYSLLRQRIGRPVDKVIDLNPAKHEKFLPGTGLRVSSPEEALAELPGGSLICIMNSQYAAEVKAMAGTSYRYMEIDHE